MRNMSKHSAAQLNTMTERELADLLGVHTQTLYRWRANGTGPRWVRLPGGRQVRYRIDAVDEWLTEHTAAAAGH